MNYKLPTTSYPNRLNDPKSTLCLSAFVAMPSFLYLCRGFFTNQLFLCKTNPILSAVGGLQMNVNKVLTKDYENKPNWTLGENKPNTNPIRTQYEPNQTQNEPKTNPIKLEAKRRSLRVSFSESSNRGPIPPHDSTTIISTVFSKCPLIKILIRLQITYNMIVSVVLSELNYEARFGQTNRCRASRPLRGRRGDRIP